MSLAVWLPLNGDLHNQGLSNITVTNNGATINNSGKIGKCYNFNNSAIGIITNNSITLGTTFSITCWIKINSYNQDWANAFKIYKDGYDYIGLCMNQANATTKQLGFHIYKNNGSNARTGVTDGYYMPLTVGKWYHLCFIVTPTQVTTYQDGIKIKTNNITVNFPSIINYNLSLGKSSLFSGLDCSINDFRLYDHALSAKEVEEIAKGLVLHYKLDNIKTSIWGLNYYKKTATLTTSNTYIYSLPSKTIYLVPGKQYTVGAQIKVNQDDIKFVFDTNCTDENGVYTGNDAAQTVQYNPTITLKKDTWTQVWVTTTIKSDAGKPYYHHGFLFRTTSGELSTLCEIQNIEIYEGSAQVFTTYDNNNIVYDSSGYGNNGIITGNLTTDSNSIRYGTTTVFPSGGYIRVEKRPATCLPKDALTVNLWQYSTSWSNPISCTEGGGWNFENSSGIRFPVYISGVGYKVAQSSITPASLNNAWHMLTGTMDKDNIKIYIDGEEAGTVTNGSTNGIGYANNYLFISGEASGNSVTPANSAYTGKLSDIRIYATALTPEQIKELYNTSMSIDNKGNIHARELVEL